MLSQNYLIIFMMIVVTMFETVPANLEAHKHKQNSSTTSIQNWNQIPNLTQHLAKSCVGENGNCRSTSECCEDSEGDDLLVCAIGGGSRRKCIPCKAIDTSCQDDPTICCDELTCVYVDKQRSFCSHCVSVHGCDDDSPCCNGYKCEYDEYGSSSCKDVCRNSGDLCDPAKTYACCNDLVCQTNDNKYFKCGPCGSKGDFCIPGETPDRCCEGYKCDPNTSKCKCAGIDLFGICLPALDLK